MSFPPALPLRRSTLQARGAAAGCHRARPLLCLSSQHRRYGLTSEIEMTQQASFAALQERIAAVNDVLNATSLLTWDSRTMMPAGGAETRGHQISTLTRVARDLLLASETEKALEEAERAIEGLPVDAAERRMVEQTRHAFEHHRSVPASLIQERAALRTVAQSAWIEARSESEFSIFAPHLAKTVELSRAYA